MGLQSEKPFGAMSARRLTDAARTASSGAGILSTFKEEGPAKHHASAATHGQRKYAQPG